MCVPMGVSECVCMLVCMLVCMRVCMCHTFIYSRLCSLDKWNEKVRFELEAISSMSG